MPLKIGCVTLMRQGSKRFPGKNIHPFLGIPLYMHTVNFAQMLGYPYVLMHNYPNLYVPSFVQVKGRGPDIENVSAEIRSLKKDWDIYILLQVTSPLRDLGTVQRAIAQFIETPKLKCLISVRLALGYGYTSDERLNFDQKKRTYSGCVRNDPLFFETGAIYIFRAEQLRKKHIVSARMNQIGMMRDTYCIDINHIEDIQKIEARIMP